MFDSLRLSVVFAAEILAEVLAELAAELAAELKAQVEIRQPKELEVLLVAVRY